MRNIIIGDIHGCAKEFGELLDKVQPGPEDRLILLGDLFDRGPDSWEVFKKVQRLEKAFGDRFVLLRGNHEDYLLREKLTLKERMIWEKVGRGTTVMSFAQHEAKIKDAAPWLAAHCRNWWKGEGFQCVHAGLLVDPLEANDMQTMIHDHGVVFRNVYNGPLTVVGHVALERPTWFKGDGETTEVLEYGEWRELPEKGVICIDTGCGKGGKLSAMVIQDSEFMIQCSE